MIQGWSPCLQDRAGALQVVAGDRGGESGRPVGIGPGVALNADQLTDGLIAGGPLQHQQPVVALYGSARVAPGRACSRR